MDKADMYFALSSFFDVLVFFGLDWKVLRGEGPMNPAKKRQIFLLILIALSFIFSCVGWYQKPESIGDVKKTSPADFKTYATVNFQGNGSCADPDNLQSDRYQWNIWGCLVNKQLDGSLRVILVFDHPLHWSGMDLYAPNGNRIIRYSYDAEQEKPRHFGRHDKVVAEILIDRSVGEKQSTVIMRPF